MTAHDDELRVDRDDGRLRVTVGDRVVAGRAIRLSGVTVDRVAAALDEPWVVTRDPPPLGASLARAARSRGYTAPQADRLAELAAALDDGRAAGEDANDGRADGGPASDDPDLAAARRRAAQAGEAVERLRERAATLRGRLAARRETGTPTDPVESELSSVMRALSEAETERHAARQSLDRARRRVRERRDRRERRLRLRDERRNRRREARAWLAACVAGPFRDAVRRVAPEHAGSHAPGGSDSAEADAGRRRDGSDRPRGDDTDEKQRGSDAGARRGEDDVNDGQRGNNADDATGADDRRERRDADDAAGATRDASVVTRLRARVPDSVTGRLAAAAVATDDGAVVLAVDRDPARLADRLARPVVRVRSA